MSTVASEYKLNGHAHLPAHEKDPSASSSASSELTMEVDPASSSAAPGTSSLRQRTTNPSSESSTNPASSSSSPLTSNPSKHDPSSSQASLVPSTRIKGSRSEMESKFLKFEREFKERLRTTDWEVPRKVLHGSVGFLVLHLHKTLPRTYPLHTLIRSLTTALVTICIADYVRLNYPSFARVYNKYLGPLMRKEEKEKVNGVVWYLIGVIFVLVVYPRDVAVVSILTLSWSDTTASTIGRLFGRYTPSLPSHFPFLPFLPIARRKSLAGFLAATFTGIVIGAYFWKDGSYGVREWGFLELGGGREASLGLGRGRVWMGQSVGLWLTALVVGLGGATVEALDLGLDDNLTLPILSGAVVWAWLTIASFIL